MKSFEYINELVLDEIRLQNETLEPKELYEPIWYTLRSGGKRLRPILVLQGCQLFHDDIEKALKPALGIELFHNFTLLHDDIMDKAAVRRNRPTVHVKWNENVGILSGDAMMIKSYELLSKTSPEYIPKVFSLFNTTALQVCEGQQFDMDYEEKDQISLSDYLKMIELKTSVLIGASLKTGAIVGGACEEDAFLFYEFGRNLGIAFQLQDDLLDLYADPLKFGKEPGNDIVSNKKTILLVQAMQLAQGHTAVELRSWMEKTDFDRNEKIMAVKTIFDHLDIREKTLEQIRQYDERAMQCLEDIPVAASAKQELTKAARLILDRKR